MTITLRPLGDCAVLAYLPDEASAQHFAKQLRVTNFPWLVDVVSAYLSVGIYFDPSRTTLADVRALLQTITIHQDSRLNGLLHTIPCCYDLQLDLERVSQHTGLPAKKIVDIHSSTDYSVYAIGFCPGFPYLGYLPPEIAGVPRLPTPRMCVEPGNIGLTARQTGIYPLPRPGGWNLIGRTPLVLVDVETGYFPIRVGDRIRFIQIDCNEYEDRKGEKLLLKHRGELDV